MSFIARRVTGKAKPTNNVKKRENMKIRITEGRWKDAIRIELQLSYVDESDCYPVDDKFRERVFQLAEDGFVTIL